MANELKPCPFCGGRAIRCGGNEYNSNHWVMCQECHVSPFGDVPLLCDTEKAWNTRPAPAEDEVTIPRNPTEAMMDVGLYHCSHDMQWSDLYTAWQAMFDAVILDGGLTEKAKASAAPVEGLETVGFVPPIFVEGKGADYNDIFRNVSITENYTAVVTRSQAEAIIAAERAESERLRTYILRAEKAEAENAAKDVVIRSHLTTIATLNTDNAALTARCADWSKSFAEKCSDYEAQKRHAEALATQLASQAAQYKDLEDYAREATKAITGLTGGGSENFSKQIGELFTADLPLCLERIRERYVSKVEVKRLEKKLATAKKALEGIAQLELGATGMTFGDQVLALTSARAALEAKP